MPSEGSKSIFDTLFGCCLGSRGRQSTSASRDDEHGEGVNGHGVDERTPLIGGKGRQDGELNDAGKRGESAGLARRPSADQGVDKRALSRKRMADAAGLRAIRDQANDAFFYIDNSQLLPSSSSSRPLNNTSSGSKKDVRGDSSRHQDLVAESDKAERLYRAALSTESEDAENLALSPEEREAPLSLVRQMKVTIREGSKAPPSTTTPTQRQRKSSSSPIEAHESIGLDVSDERGRNGYHHAISKFPSLHSLRTLRLGPSSHGTPSIGSEKVSPTLEDEDWSQRGRTRSKRGLAWMDVGPTEEVQQQSKTKLQEIFQEEQKEELPNAERVMSAKADEEEVPNALRLTSKQTDTMKNVQERLKASTSIAGLWDSTQDS